MLGMKIKLRHVFFEWSVPSDNLSDKYSSIFLGIVSGILPDTHSVSLLGWYLNMYADILSWGRHWRPQPTWELFRNRCASRGCGRIWQARFVFIGCFWNSVHSLENELLEQFFAFRGCGRIWQARFVFIGCFWNSVHCPENELLEQFFAFRGCGRIWQARFVFIGCFWNSVHSPENELLEQFFAFRGCGRIWQARFVLIAMTADRTRSRTRTGPDPTRTRAPDPDRTGRTLVPCDISLPINTFGLAVGSTGLPNQWCPVCPFRKT